jgi:hypothetical protein
MNTLRFGPRAVGIALFAVIASLFAVLLGLSLASPTHAAAEDANPPGTVLGTTEGWFNGTTVTFLYTRDFVCTQPQDGLPVGADSGCEVGSPGESAPIGNPDIPELWVLVPLGFNPLSSTLQCPLAGNCVAHPHDIDLSRIFGPGFADVPTPAHSHVIDDLQGGWWESYIVGITSQSAWDRLVAGKSLATVRELQAEGLATADIPTNLFLFFNVLPAAPT